MPQVASTDIQDQIWITMIKHTAVFRESQHDTVLFRCDRVNITVYKKSKQMHLEPYILMVQGDSEMTKLQYIPNPW
jgi:hypothetical protein